MVAEQCIRDRKTRLLEQANMVSALGLPIKRRSDAVSNILVPVVRKSGQPFYHRRRRRRSSQNQRSLIRSTTTSSLLSTDYRRALNAARALSSTWKRSRFVTSFSWT